MNMSSPPSSAISSLLLGQGWSLTNTGCNIDEARSMASWKVSGNLRTLVSAATQAELDQEEEGQPDEIDFNVPTRKKKRVYKKRKSTHTVRKEERQTLEMEIQNLEKELEALKLRQLILNGHENPSTLNQISHNSELRGVLQEQHLVIATTQALLAGCAQRHSHHVRPTEMYIRLEADQDRRHEVLSSLRGPKLQCAKKFIEQRSLGLHPTSNYLNEERYETAEGDYCNVRFDRTSLRNVKGGVRAVFEALKRAVFNAEIILSEASDNITIREDDDLDDNADFSQSRLVTETTSGVLVENNLVHFSEFVQAEKQSDSYAVATADFVNEDDRFPYRPNERLRRDTTFIMLVTLHKTTSLSKNSDVDSYSGHTSSEEENIGDAVVVMTRWTFSRICRTDLDVPIQHLREMRDRSGQIAETILSCVRESLGLPK